MGGSVSTSISSKTNILVHSDFDNDVTSSKLDKAKSLNITIMSKSDFINKYINI
jgi:NAD-dependent DNA ligase